MSAKPKISATAITWIARRDGMDLAVKAGSSATSGIGSVILNPADPQLIDGVQALPFPLWPDDRGYFLEVARIGEDIAQGFEGSTQISATLSYPGAIKALHFHCRQTDLWVPVRGMFQVVLYDLRVGSPSFGKTNTLYIGALRPWKVLIPPGVAHGYRVLGPELAMLVYVTNRFYDPVDEGRIAYDHADINYDWELQHK